MGQRTGKAKREKLQEQRRKARERQEQQQQQVEERRAPKVVQARCYTYRKERGAEVGVRLRLSIDRSLCRGFGDGGSAADEASSASPQPLETANQRCLRQLNHRISMLAAKLSEVGRLKAGGAEQQWLAALAGVTQIALEERKMQAVDASDGDSKIFGLVQQALQTGPLTYAKPAQFKRFGRACASDGAVTRGGLHPHAAAVAKLLDASAAACATQKQRAVLAEWDTEFDAIFGSRRRSAPGSVQKPPSRSELAPAAEPAVRCPSEREPSERSLPPKLESVQRSRLAMRLDASSASSAAPSPPLPLPYRLVWFGEVAAADRAAWAEIIAAAGERPSAREADGQFEAEFADWALSELPRRMLFVLDAAGRAVGTATAWFVAGPASLGRVHWVSLVPAAQGRGLAKPMLAAVLTRLQQLHPDGAMLVTHTQAARAIQMYLQSGFVPQPLDAQRQAGFAPEELSGWESMAALGLSVPALQ